MRLFGIETEYGITREDLDQVDPVVESMGLVRAYAEGGFERLWDYSGEDPHEDARGFRVTGLEQDREEEEFARRDAQRPFSYHEMKSDLVLSNGARFYNDHTHPEYSTPECRRLTDLVAHDRAGERILRLAAIRRNRELGAAPTGAVQLYKNNTDFHGHSYGCHDNYLLDRAIPFSDLTAGLLPFLVTRQLFAGAGKVGIESQEGGFRPGCYQLSQRADFMEAELGVDTMHNRPLLNTRDEPHADRRRFRRLHLIVGDANMCEYATALKVGTTQLVLELVARGRAPAIALAQPVLAVRSVSRDPDLKVRLQLRSGGTASALEIQHAYLAAARRHLAGQGESAEETDWILAQWQETLAALEHDRSRLVGRLDWVTKLWLLESFVQEQRLAWDDPWLASLDLEYHNLDPERGLFLGLEAEGRVARVVTDAEIDAAMRSGPLDTRGGLRGLCVERFRPDIRAVQWESVRFKGWGERTLDLGDALTPARVAPLRELLLTAASADEVLAGMRRARAAEPTS